MPHSRGFISLSFLQLFRGFDYWPLYRGLQLYGGSSVGVYVVIQFYPWLKFYFPFFLGIAMYDNEC